MYLTTHLNHASETSKSLPETNEFIFNIVRIQATVPSFRFSDLIYPQTDQPPHNDHSVDSEICKSAVTQKLDLQKQLYSVLQGEVKPSGSLTSSGQRRKEPLITQMASRSLVITQCCIHELYLQGKEQQPAVDLAKNFERRKCNHREAIPGDECLTSIIGNLFLLPWYFSIEALQVPTISIDM